MLRRRALLGIIGGALVKPALAGISYYPNDVIVPPGPVPPSPQFHISYGQSWRSNDFPSFDGFSIDPTGKSFDPLHVSNIGLPTLLPGPLTDGAGINPGLWTRIDGITTYTGADNVSIGRCAIVAQQVLRANAGITIVPMSEFCCAYPSSTWTTGAGGGGLQPGGVPWTNQLGVISKIASLVLAGKLTSTNYVSVGYTQGGSATDTQAAKIADLTAMLQDYDALNLPGAGLTGMKYYIGQAAPNSTQTILQQSEYGSAVFCRTNAPGQGGTWSGRCFASTPWYQWPFNGSDNIHTNDYGTVRHGEFEGYVKFQVEDKSVSWTPLWVSLTTPISVAGQVITVPFARPAGADFAAGTLEYAVGDDNNGGATIPLAPQKGFHVLRSGVELTVSPAISGLNVLLTISETLNASDSLEVSYAYRGPGGTNPGTHSGVWGNLVMRGPSSVLFSSKTIDAWAWPHVATVTV